MFKRISLLLLSVLVIFIPFYVDAQVLREKSSSNNYELVIDDSAEIYTNEQLTSIKNYMVPLLEKGNVVLKTVKSAGEKNINAVATEEYNKLFNYQSGLIFLINIYNGIDSELSNHNYLTVIPFGDFSLTEDQQTLYQNNKSLLQSGEYFTLTKNIFTSLSGTAETSNLTVSSGDKYKIVIEDDANLLTDEEKQKLIKKMTPLTEYGHAIFKTIDHNTAYSTADYAKSYYYNHFSNENGSLLLIDMDNRIVYICSGGDNYKIITTSKAEIITDNIYRYLSYEDYYTGASKAFDQMNKLLMGYKIAEPMRYASNIVISLVVAFFINFIIIMITCSRKRAKHDASTLGLDMAVALNSFKALSDGTHRVYSPVSSDSGGSSGGFSSGGHSGGGFSGGGGGFSGGGGGHRF